MLHHDRIDISKKIDLTKRNNEKCTICHYCFFLIIGSNLKLIFVKVAMI